MRMFQGVIEGVIFLILLGVVIWWTIFCFSKGYNLGKHGTDNRLLNWAIAALLDDDSQKKADDQDKPEFDFNPLDWLKEIAD